MLRMRRGGKGWSYRVDDLEYLAIWYAGHGSGRCTKTTIRCGSAQELTRKSGRFDLVLVACLIYVGCFAQRYRASELFHRRVLGEFWSRYTHLENVVPKKLELCAISLTKAPGMEAWISSYLLRYHCLSV